MPRSDVLPNPACSDDARCPHQSNRLIPQGIDSGTDGMMEGDRVLGDENLLEHVMATIWAAIEQTPVDVASDVPPEAR